MKDNVGISLAKALKLKNRLAGRLAKTTSTMLQYNSVLEGHKEVDVLDLDKQRAELSESLVDLKTAIYEANKGIYRFINQMSEKKSEIDFLNSLQTRNGVEPGYGENTHIYVAAIKKVDVDKRVKLLEKEIDDLQDQIDRYNAEAGRIRIDAHILELAS